MDSYYTDEQTFEYEEERRFFTDEDHEEEESYESEDEATNGEFEEKENDDEGMGEGQVLEESLFDNQYEQINEGDYLELTDKNLPFSMKDLYGGPLTSLQQIKMLYSDKNQKINFGELSDIDLFKVITTISAYSNKLHLSLQKINLKNSIEDMLSKSDKIPDIKYKNPLACLLSFICIKRNGEIDKTQLEQIYNILDSVKLNNYDIFRYCRMWQKIYKKKIDCSS
jgi:hypothetical protein